MAKIVFAQLRLECNYSHSCRWPIWPQWYLPELNCIWFTAVAFHNFWEIRLDKILWPKSSEVLPVGGHKTLTESATLAQFKVPWEEVSFCEKKLEIRTTVLNRTTLPNDLPIFWSYHQRPTCILQHSRNPFHWGWGKKRAFPSAALLAHPPQLGSSHCLSSKEVLKHGQSLDSIVMGLIVMVTFVCSQSFNLLMVPVYLIAWWFLTLPLVS